MKYDGWYDIDHMRQYLRRCVIRIEDEPIYVLEINNARNRAGRPIQKIYYTRLGHNEQKSINIKSRRVNLAPVPLGLINFQDGEDECIVASRVPARMWKWGLNSNNLNLSPVAGKNVLERDKDSTLLSLNLRACIVGAYPTYKEACDVIEQANIYSTIAFHRHFAIQKRRRRIVLVYYKYDILVGECKDQKPTLINTFSFLQEHLNEVV